MPKTTAKNEPVKIVVHHTASLILEPQINHIDKWHKDRGFSKSTLGYYVGYHYLIERDGSIMQTRADEDEGCHTIGHNLSSLGVALAGDFTKERPTRAQMDSLGVLLNELCAKYDIHPLEIYPHRKLASTVCYGSLLENDFAVLAYATAPASPAKSILNKLNPWK